MSRPRSPHYRRFSWEGPDYHPHVVAKMERNLPGGFREDFREGMYPIGGARRSPPSCQKVFPSMRFSPRQDQEQRPRPPQDPDQDQGWAGGGRREGFQPHIHNYGDRRRPPPIPNTFKTHPDPPHRERLPPTFRIHSDLPHREMEQGRGRGRGGRGNAPRGRLTEDSQTLISPPMKKQRAEREEDHQPGFRHEEDSGGRSYSLPRPGPGGNGRLPHPVIFDHDHGFLNSNRDRVEQRRDRVDQPRDHIDQPRDRVDQRRDHLVDQQQEHVDHLRGYVDHRREKVDHRREHMDHRQEHVDQRLEHVDQRREHVDLQQGPSTDSGGWNAGRARPFPSHFSQERSRMWGSRSEERGDTRKRHHQDDSLRGPDPQDRAKRLGPSGSSMGPRGASHPMNNLYHQNRGGRGQPPHRYQDRRQEGFRPVPRTIRPQQQEEEENEDLFGRTGLQQWHHSRSTSLDKDQNQEPRTPQQKRCDWTEPRTKNVAGEETLTIRVDTSGPARISSPLCYSSDRQLSLDLVNVGRQRVDFLPLLEHSGTYRERDGQGGTFAQEIITLVHQVKDQYFRGDGITLNQRFSAPQTPRCSGEEEEEEEEELTLDKRFTANRGFSLDLSSFLEETEPLSSSLERLQGLNHQPIRGPGDLRHDLERRRQERLEGVKVTIAGSLVGQRPLAAVRDPEQSSWKEQEDVWWEEPNRRSEGRKGEDSRIQSSYQGRNSRHPPSRPTDPLW